MIHATPTDPVIIITAKIGRDDEPTQPSERDAEPTEQVETQCEDDECAPE